MKINYNLTLIMYIKSLKSQKLIKTWAEGARIYFDVEKQEITPTALSNQAKKLLMSSINMQLLFNYFEMTDQLIAKPELESEPFVEENNDFKLATDAIIRTLSIPEEDYKTVFDIDIENDSKELIRKKITNKITDDVFLLNYLGFNPGYYEVQKIVSGAWTTPVKVENSAGEKSVEVILNEKFSVVIGKRKNALLYYTKEECDEWLDNYFKTRKITPFDFFEEKQKTKGKKEEYDQNLIMVCPGPELHLGKLGSVVDYEDYSTKQAMWRLKQTAFEIAKYQEKNKASALILGIGNDYYNSDTVDDKTTAGTPQYNDSRFKEVYLWGKIGYFQMIETLKSKFDKIVLKGNPGNHDEKSSFSLFTNMYDIYNITQDPKIDVSFSYKDLRYTTCYEYGCNLIVFSHGKSPEGKNLKDQALAESIKYQFPEEYDRARNVYVFAGHIHQDSENKFDKVTVLRTASLTGIESWHYSNLYLGQRQGHSVYLIDKDKGYVGKNNITITKEEKNNKIKGANRNEDTNIVNAMTKALDLTENSYNAEKTKKELAQLKRQMTIVTKEHKLLVDAIGEVLGLDMSGYSEEEITELMTLLGYKEKITPLENKKQLILKYKNK
ncbi:MAG: hypothetical protein PHW32_03365 [Bacilli bacterium]|nr:hypothetical protein [Bacilli bacterium]MDD4718737.1 hypothetical protein [Bacilli bacterium]